MIHFKPNIFFEENRFARQEFLKIFAERVYEWDNHLGVCGDMFGVTDDPYFPTWGVFGRYSDSYQHSQLYGHRLFILSLAYGEVDLSVVINSMKNFDYIITNDFCLKIDGSIPIDGFNKVFPLPERYKITAKTKF